MSTTIQIPDPPIVIEDDNAISAAELKGLQQLAIIALLPGTNLSEAAALCGVARMTIWRWSKLPHFQAALQAAREEAFDQASAQLKFASRDAVTVLTRNLDSGNPVLEIRSAVAILNHVQKAIHTLNHQSSVVAAENTSKDPHPNEETHLPKDA